MHKVKPHNNDNNIVSSFKKRLPPLASLRSQSTAEKCLERERRIDAETRNNSENEEDDQFPSTSSSTMSTGDASDDLKEDGKCSPPVVDTQSGKIMGRHVTLKDGRRMSAFVGIPYAKPPIGQLRFKKPQPLEGRWDGILSARSYKRRSIQKDFFWDWMELRVGKSEDCLYLNVVAPDAQFNEQTQLKKYPVMVYIHGGGFVMDSAVKYPYTNIARTLVCHNVIVVTIQYRLGFLGYFCSGDENAAGNYGLWDQLMALQWVHDNISGFGGDPDNITLFGQSAGAVSIDLLSISPLSKHFFDKAILMGGTAETIWAISPKQRMVDYCRAKALKLGFQRRTDGDEWSSEENARMMEFLRQIRANKFETTMIGDRTIVGQLRIPITPIIDGEILPRPVEELRFMEPRRRKIIAGITEFEGLLFLAIGFHRANRKLLTFCEERAMEMVAQVNRTLSADQPPLTMETFRRLYGINDEMRKDRALVQKTCVMIMSDLVNEFALHNFCAKARAAGSTIYRYSFEHSNPHATAALNPMLPFRGATHCTELNYLFDISMFFLPWRKNAADRRVLCTIGRLWTNFAKYGDPNGRTVSVTANNNGGGDGDSGCCSGGGRSEDDCLADDNTFWPPLSDDRPETHLAIGDPSKVRHRLATERVRVLAPLLDRIPRVA